jgi:hypothetical protein
MPGYCAACAPLQPAAAAAPPHPCQGEHLTRLVELLQKYEGPAARGGVVAGDAAGLLASVGKGGQAGGGAGARSQPGGRGGSQGGPMGLGGGSGPKSMRALYLERFGESTEEEVRRRRGQGGADAEEGGRSEAAGGTARGRAKMCAQAEWWCHDTRVCVYVYVSAAPAGRRRAYGSAHRPGAGAGPCPRDCGGAGVTWLWKPSMCRSPLQS